MALLVCEALFSYTAWTTRKVVTEIGRMVISLASCLWRARRCQLFCSCSINLLLFTTKLLYAWYYAICKNIYHKWSVAWSWETCSHNMHYMHSDKQQTIAKKQLSVPETARRFVCRHVPLFIIVTPSFIITVFWDRKCTIFWNFMKAWNVLS